MSIYGIDHETTSAEDITKGVWRYASHPSTRILMTAVIKDDGEPALWNFLEPDSEESRHAKSLLAEAVWSRSEIFAFNAGFELAVNHYRLITDMGNTPPTIEQLRCSQAMARRAAIPASLAKASEFLKLGVDKDARGKALIHIFSDQSKLTTLTLGKEKRKSASPVLETPIPWNWTLTVAGDTVTVREAWDMFCAYCKKDTVVEREVRKALDRFTLEGAELDGYQFTSRMNQAGAPVNLQAAMNAQVILDEHREHLEAEFHRITGLMPTQTAKVLAWLKTHGYPEGNLQSATMDAMRGSPLLTPIGARALEIRSDLSFAAVKKVRTLIDTVCPDETLKGSFTWYGASATGRWTSSNFQLQNARKSTIGNTDMAYHYLREGIDTETFGMVFGNPYEAVASCIRNFVQPHGGATMLSVDYSNIESRVAAMIAGQADLLDTYREGRDAYKELASKVFGVRVEDVTKEQRFVGKVGNLSLVFQTGAKTFHETCAAWGMPIEKKLACATVKTFRTENAQFPITWRKFEAAAVKAIKEPGSWVEANEFVAFASSIKAPFPRLMMRLASGRSLCYPLPQVNRTIKKHRDYESGETREWESDDITFWGQLRGTAAWGRVSTYAGSLFQSSVQGTARDIMQHGCVTAQNRGYNIFSIIHDEVLAHNDHADGLAGLEASLCSHPEWLADDFPLEVSGAVCSHYTKD